MLIEWSIAAAAMSFVVLVAGILYAIRIGLKRLERMQASAEALQEELQQLSAQASSLLVPAEETIKTLKEGVQSAEGLFKAVKGAGHTIHQSTSALERVTSTLSDSAVRHAEQLAGKRQLDEAVQWAELGLTAWHLWQWGRKSEAKTDSGRSYSGRG